MARKKTIETTIQISGKLTSEQRNKVVEEYIPLIRFIAKKISIRLPVNIKIEDLISSGVMGLMDAIEKYDSSRDNKFKTYAEFRIRGSILDELRAQDWIPRSVRDKSKMLDKATSTLESSLGRVPTDVEISEYLGLTINEFYDLTNQVRPVNILSIDESASFSSVDKKSFLSILEKDGDPFMELNVKTIKKLIKQSIEELPERQRIVLSLYYYEGFNLKKIGVVLGVTESRISQLHAQAIKRLKIKFQKKFKDYELKVA